MKAEKFEQELKAQADEAWQRIMDIYDKSDKEFQNWKEEVLKFEYVESGSDDSTECDDRVCDGECVWPAEDEDYIQFPVGQTG